MRIWWRVIEIFSKWLGQASLKTISDDFWKRRASPVEYLKKELSDRRESQFQGARVRVCHQGMAGRPVQLESSG